MPTQFYIPVSRGKEEMKTLVRYFILSHCDEDISRAFEHHTYTLEPLLCQIIRQLKKGEDGYDGYLSAIAELVSALDPTNGGYSGIRSREDGATVRGGDIESGDHGESGAGGADDGSEK
jgi:hypothetical protein